MYLVGASFKHRMILFVIYLLISVLIFTKYNVHFDFSNCGQFLNTFQIFFNFFSSKCLDLNCILDFVQQKSKLSKELRKYVASIPKLSKETVILHF